MKQLSLTLVFIVCIYCQLTAQNIKLDDTNSINSVELNTQLSELESQVYLITGNEDIYKKYDWLRESMLRNIQNGIREGIYDGNIHNNIYDIKATKTTFFFYKDELFKIRWSFNTTEFSNLSELANTISSKLTSDFGTPHDEGFMSMKTWHGNKNYMQIFLDEKEFQIELRDEQINKIVENL